MTSYAHVTYPTMLHRLASGEKQASKNITFQSRPDEAVAVRLHETDILTFYPDNTCIYDNGGYTTKYTRDTLNTYGPGYVYTDRGRWYYGVGDGMVTPYYNGLTVKCGVTPEIVSIPPFWANDKVIKSANALINRNVKLYLDGLTDEQWCRTRDHLLDCPDCEKLVHSPDEVREIINTGSPFAGLASKIARHPDEKLAQHLMQHMRLKEYPWSLLRAATQEAGYGTFVSLDASLLHSPLKKYLYRRLLPGAVEVR